MSDRFGQEVTTPRMTEQLDAQAAAVAGDIIELLASSGGEFVPGILHDEIADRLKHSFGVVFDHGFLTAEEQLRKVN